MTEEEKKAALKAGDIVVVTSDATASANPGIQYLGAVVVVHEVRSWGVLGAIPVPWAGLDAIIPIRLAWEDFALTGGRISLWDINVDAEAIAAAERGDR